MKQLLAILLLFIITTNLGVTVTEQYKDGYSCEMKSDCEEDTKDLIEKDKMEKDFYLPNFISTFIVSHQFIEKKTPINPVEDTLTHELHLNMLELPPEA